MSKKIECRLPDQLYTDLKAKCHDKGITVTDIVITKLTEWLYHDEVVMTKKPEYHDKAKAKKPIVDAISKAEIQAEVVHIHPDPVTTYIPLSPSDLRAKYKASHPLDICNRCHRYNRECVC
jgi:hypothetical protein